MSIQNRALLVSLKCSAWTARKYDKRVTERTNAEYAASQDAGRYNKHLLPGDAASYKALSQHLSAMRQKHYENTLYWSDDNVRLLCIDNQEQYRNTVEIHGRSTFQALLEEFISEFPSLRDTARMKLNGMFRDEDYPNVATLRTKFGYSVEYWPVPENFGTVEGVHPAVREIMESALRDRVDQATSAAMADAWQRLYTCVEHLHERLAQPGQIFRDSLVGNVREVCDVLTRLNPSNDVELETMRAAVQLQLSRFDPQTLRDNAGLRAAVATTAGRLAETIRATRHISVVAETVNT